MSELSPPTPLSGTDAAPTSVDTDQRGTMRALAEAFVSLFIAVLLFRAFAAEGYMISTGSMAPCLLGFHKRVVCPTCQVTFPFGTAYDTDEEADVDSLSANRAHAVCPNCGQPGIDLTDVPRNHGDQLLVNKQAYLYQSPQRWDVIVFRNPFRPTEAYVKRTVALPGERVQIVDGDVIIDGQIARKNYRQQVGTRILVHDHDFRPAKDEDFRTHWQIVEPDAPGSDRSKPLTWKAVGSSFQFRGEDVRRPDKDPMAWVEYRHWVRSGGQHETSVPLATWPEDADTKTLPPAGLQYNVKKRLFSVTGALPESVARKLLDLSDDKEFQDAVVDLYESSHVIPVNDEYGYNPPDEAPTPNPVKDLMVSADIKLQGGSGEFVIESTDGSSIFSVVFDVIRREINLYIDPQSTFGSHSMGIRSGTEAVATAQWPGSFVSDGGKVEVSIFDQQVVVAIDGKPVFAPWPFEVQEDAAPSRHPVRFGARGVNIKVSHLKLYRDIYYTDTRSRHAVSRPHELGDDEYFVLGDNSPVSHDSRRWEKPAVQRALLIGKPFLVHLPSKPGTLRVGNQEMHLRIPDWERIRFLR